MIEGYFYASGLGEFGLTLKAASRSLLSQGTKETSLVSGQFLKAGINDNIGLGAGSGSNNLWKVGTYEELRGLKSRFDAHHVGQKKLMAEFIPGYDLDLGPSILVPQLGHTKSHPLYGIVSRSTKGILNERQFLARDVFELRRVYGSQGIPNASLQELIQLNKSSYPGAFIKK